MPEKRISVVVPCFNEEKTIRENLKKIHRYVADNFSEFEIIAVNDGSSDGTLSEIEKTQKEIPVRLVNNKKNQGKGKAVRDGTLLAQFDIIMFLDADLGIPIEELEKFIAEIEKGFDMVIASRFVPGLKIKKPVKLHRRFMERVFRLMRLAILNDWEVKDTQCGFKVFRRAIATYVFPKLTVNRFAFDAELVFSARKKNFKIKELPISLQNPPESAVRILRDPSNMMLDLIRIKINDWQGKYK